MKKKSFLLILIIIILTGCTNINNLTYQDIINEVLPVTKNTNTHRNGYSFYVPKGLQVNDAGSRYVTLNNDHFNYYLYVDFLSYKNKKELNYEPNANAYYSSILNYDGKNGYVEINLWENEHYLIEIMYNYAKIEVMVDENEIKEALINSCLILKSIQYNDTIIDILLTDDNLDYTEEIFDIFKNKENSSN